MKKKAIVLFGSPRKNGFTNKLLSFFMENLKDYEFSTIYAYDMSIHPCVDCKLCRDNEICKYDDLDFFDNFLKTADLIVVATPVYNMSFPSPLKAIFDRTQRYFYAKFFRSKVKPIDKEKNAVLLITCGSNDTRSVKMLREQINRIFKLINAKLLNTIVWYNTDKNDNIESLKSEIKDVIIRLND